MRRYKFSANTRINRLCMLEYLSYVWISSRVLPPSGITVPISHRNKENSGILPKRHKIRVPLNELRWMVYNMIYRRLALNVHFWVFSLWKSSSATRKAVNRHQGVWRSRHSANIFAEQVGGERTHWHENEKSQNHGRVNVLKRHLSADWL